MGRASAGFERVPAGMRPPPRERRPDDRDRAGPGDPPATGVLRLRGLPFGVSPDDIAAWFNDAGVLQQPITVQECVPISKAHILPPFPLQHSEQLSCMPEQSIQVLK